MLRKPSDSSHHATSNLGRKGRHIKAELKCSRDSEIIVMWARERTMKELGTELSQETGRGFEPFVTVLFLTVPGAVSNSQ